MPKLQSFRNFLSDLIMIFSTPEGLPQVQIRRGRGGKDIIFNEEPEKALKWAQRRCPGTYTQADFDDLSQNKCPICNQWCSTVSHYTYKGRRLGSVLEEHFCDAIRQCAECDGGIWDDHYLCEECRE